MVLPKVLSPDGWYGTLAMPPVSVAPVTVSVSVASGCPGANLSAGSFASLTPFMLVSAKTIHPSRHADAVQFVLSLLVHTYAVTLRLTASERARLRSAMRSFARAVMRAFR